MQGKPIREGKVCLDYSSRWIDGGRFREDVPRVATRAVGGWHSFLFGRTYVSSWKKFYLSNFHQLQSNRILMPRCLYAFLRRRYCLTFFTLSTTTVAFPHFSAFSQSSMSNGATATSRSHNFLHGPPPGNGHAKQDPYLPTMIVFDLGTSLFDKARQLSGISTFIYLRVLAN